MAEKSVTVAVEAEREGKWWILRLDDGGVTQARSLGEVDEMVADYVSLTRGVPADVVHVVLSSVALGASMADEVAAARRARAEADRAQEIAAAAIRKTATALRRSGLAGIEVARVLGVSPQRVSQLTAAKASATTPVAAQAVRATSGATKASPRKTGATKAPAVKGATRKTSPVRVTATKASPVKVTATKTSVVNGATKAARPAKRTTRKA